VKLAELLPARGPKGLIVELISPVRALARGILNNYNDIRHAELNHARAVRHHPMAAPRVLSGESMCRHPLSRAEAMMDVTLMDGCLVCSAYKAVAVGEPTRLSDNAASKELFAEAAVFADSVAAKIGAAGRKLTGVRA
jgi:hypothetical protein